MGKPTPIQLFLYDGNATRGLELDGSRGLIHSPRLSDRGVTWFEFDVPTALCHGHTIGRVMYRDLESNEQVQLGGVLAPCLCCDSSDEDLVLSVADGVVSWNNARLESRRTSRTVTGYGYATVEK